ncbi:MAG: hypothetical protein ACOC16_03710 [Nanoarchaeota archaeon]
MVKSKKKVNLKAKNTIQKTNIESIYHRIKEISRNHAKVTSPTSYCNIPASVIVKNSIGILDKNQIFRLDSKKRNNHGINLILSKDKKTNKGAIISIIPKDNLSKNRIAKKILNIYYGLNIKNHIQTNDTINYLMHEIYLMPGVFGQINNNIIYQDSNSQAQTGIYQIQSLNNNTIKTLLKTQEIPYVGLEVLISTNQNYQKILKEKLNNFEYMPYNFFEFLKHLKK